MKITKITQQLKQTNRYSVYIDDQYLFSLSEVALLESGINKGRELSEQELANFKQLSLDDKIYGQALRYVALRPRTAWEMQSYMERKGAAPALIPDILNKLSNVGLIDDYKYAEAFARERRLLRSSSRRKIIFELRKKRVSDGAIQAALGNEPDDERTALIELVARKRRQTKYQDNTKLMQYLARQGFNYGDIKDALAASE